MLSYAQQKILIIDDFPEFRLSLKLILQQLGATEIDIASDGMTGINMCQQKSYDIILSDYNLGDGKDGQQVLEELVLRDLLKPTTVFVIITAENTTEMVMAAIEHTPDSYLTKPFTKDEIKSRLDKLLHKKISLEMINRAIITRNYPKALKLADAMIAANSRYTMACMRIKSELYLKMTDLASAKEIFQRVLNKRPITWALLGLGKLQFAEENYRQALESFNSVLKQLPNYPEALDWIAKIEQLEGKSEQALKTLQLAVSVSPKVCLRQIKLGDLARQTGALEIAKRAFRNAIKYSEDSVHRTPESYLKLVSILIEELTSSGGIKNKRISSDALLHLKKLEQAYATDKEIKLRASISRHAIYHKLGREQEKYKHLDIAKALFSELSESVSGHTTTDMAGAYLREEDYEACQTLLSTVIEKFGHDEEIMASVELIIDDKKAFNQAVEASKVNNQGIKEHAVNNRIKAIEYFRKAIKLAPKNISFKMNLIQELIRRCDSPSVDKRTILAEIDEQLSAAAYMSQKDYRYLRLQQLQRMANDIKISLTV